MERRGKSAEDRPGDTPVALTSAKRVCYNLTEPSVFSLFARLCLAS